MFTLPVTAPLMSLWAQPCDILNALQKSVGYRLFFTLKEHKVNHSEALTRHQLSPTEGPCSPEAMEPSLAWPCPTWLEASWSWSFLLQTGCCFPNRPPRAPKYCSTDHKLKWVLIHLSGLMAGSPHSRTLCCRDLNSFGGCGFAVLSKPN